MLLTQAYGYGPSVGTYIPGISAELLSLFFILGSFVVISYLAIKVRTVHSFQFEMFLFVLVLAVSEVPYSLSMMHVIDLGGLVTYGLWIHSASMVILAGFVAYRIYGFFRGNANALK